MGKWAGARAAIAATAGSYVLIALRWAVGTPSSHSPLLLWALGCFQNPLYPYLPTLYPRSLPPLYPALSTPSLPPLYPLSTPLSTSLSTPLSTLSLPPLYPSLCLPLFSPLFSPLQPLSTHHKAESEAKAALEVKQQAATAAESTRVALDAAEKGLEVMQVCGEQ